MASLLRDLNVVGALSSNLYAWDHLVKEGALKAANTLRLRLNAAESVVDFLGKIGFRVCIKRGRLTSGMSKREAHMRDTSPRVLSGSLGSIVGVLWEYKEFCAPLPSRPPTSHK